METVDEDEDVHTERLRVESGAAEFDLVQLHRLTKTYQLIHKKIIAVNNISLGIPAGEVGGVVWLCFLEIENPSPEYFHSLGRYVCLYVCLYVCVCMYACVYVYMHCVNLHGLCVPCVKEHMGEGIWPSGAGCELPGGCCGPSLVPCKSSKHC